MLTATFLVVRLYCSFMMEYDVHTLLDLLTAAATGGVLYAMLATPVSERGGGGRPAGWLAGCLVFESWRGRGGSGACPAVRRQKQRGGARSEPGAAAGEGRF